MCGDNWPAAITAWPLASIYYRNCNFLWGQKSVKILVETQVPVHEAKTTG